jgi:hypothetical protein
MTFVLPLAFNGAAASTRVIGERGQHGERRSIHHQSEELQRAIRFS